LAKDENSKLLAGLYNIFNRWKTFCSEIRKLNNSIWNKNFHSSRMNLLLCLCIKRMLNVVITEGCHCYQLHTKFYPISFTEG